MLADMEAGYIGVKELAARLAISTRSIWRFIERRELAVVRVGRRTLVAKSEVAKWLAGNETQTPGARLSNIARQLSPR